jgi:hypothetical protein
MKRCHWFLRLLIIGCMFLTLISSCTSNELDLPFNLTGIVQDDEGVPVTDAWVRVNMQISRS